MASDANPPAKADEPRRSQLRRILDEESPEVRKKVGRAIFSLSLTALVTIALLGVFLIWHLMRRARLIRERLPLPREIELVDPLAKPTDEFPVSNPESKRPT